MEVKRSIFLYRLYVLLYVISTLPALTILFGLKIFCNESFYAVYLGAYTVCNIYLVIIEIVVFGLFLIYTYFFNKIIRKVTKPFDEGLEENLTVVRNYSKYNLEYYYLIPILFLILVSSLSHLEVFTECSTGLFLIIVLGIIQLVFGLVIFYNCIQYMIFLEDNGLKKRK